MALCFKISCKLGKGNQRSFHEFQISILPTLYLSGTPWGGIKLCAFENVLKI